MEHRHGNRVPISAAVRIEFSSRAVEGRIVNASLSGAFAMVSGRIPDHTRVVVAGLEEPGGKESWRVPAHVVRQAATWVGLEWDEFGPLPILELIRQSAAPRAQHPRRDLRHQRGSIGNVRA